MSREEQIDRVVADTGMGRLQAHYHLQGRAAAAAIEDRRRAAAARGNVDTFRSIGEIVRAQLKDFLIVEDEAAFERSMSASLELKPGGVCRVDGLRKWDWIDRLTPADAADALRQPISESRKTCPFPISRAEFARLKAKASS